MQIKNGSLFLFRLFGVNVYVHWSWAIVAVIQIYLRQQHGTLVFNDPSTVPYHIGLYLSLFAIVLTHEFGHALACKSVGGRAQEIMLWPLGGVAYVQPPQRALPYLWSIFAGPMVNMILVPLTLVPAYLLWGVMPHTNAANFLVDLCFINAMLLIFNMLPFYPLDGGQILRGLIWLVTGRSLSLVISTIIGIIGAVLLGLFAIWVGGIYLGVMVFFMGSRSIQSLRIAWQMYRIERGPRHEHAQCPHCRQHPPAAEIWMCPCGIRFDTFVTGAQCPNCGQQFPTTACPLCGESSAMHLWFPLTAVANTPENSVPPPPNP